jgi:uroporphyrinogen-III decarboxylase
MNARERVLAKNPLAPVVYEHAAAFINKSPWEASRSAELLAAAHIEAHRVYNHSPITLGIDIYNIEPEAYGALVPEPSGNEVPTITDFPFDEPEALLNLKPLDLFTSGRWPLLLEAAKIVKKELPNCNLRLPLGGPFSIAVNLIGFEKFLMYAFMNEKTAGKILLKLSEHQVHLVKQIKEEGFDVTFFESAATPPMLSPELFRTLELPSLKYIISEINKLSANKAALIMGGDTALIAGDIAAAGAGFLICPAETDQALFLKNLKGIDIAVRINMDAAILASGNKELISSEIERIGSLKEEFFPGATLGTGVLPYDGNVKLVKRLSESLI